MNRDFREPKISVVIPVYNAERYLAQAIGSIIEQSFPYWEMICVNDGSTDGSGTLLERLQAMDSRIQVVHQSNTGIVGALNHGCSLARSPLLCRMDADDIAMPHRLQSQWDYMQSHPECVALGGSILAMDSETAPLGVQNLYCDHNQIVEGMLRRDTGLFHPTTMIRNEAFDGVGGYRMQYQWIEDHDLWLRLSQVGKLANTHDVVLCYRQHASSVCWQRATQQRDLMTQLLREAHEERGLPIPAAPGIITRMPRSGANPGKWARIAARGGYPRSACKHLWRVWNERGLSVYSLRMSAEVAARMPSGWLKRKSRHSPIDVPNLERWSTIAA